MKVAEFINAPADNLELHMPSLERANPNSALEYEAYARLARGYREIAVSLNSTAGQMKSYRDLPMGRHDEKVLARPEVLEAFERFVRIERELVSTVEQSVEEHSAMLRGHHAYP